MSKAPQWSQLEFDLDNALSAFLLLCALQRPTRVIQLVGSKNDCKQWRGELDGAMLQLAWLRGILAHLIHLNSKPQRCKRVLDFCDTKAA